MKKNHASLRAASAKSASADGGGGVVDDQQGDQAAALQVALEKAGCSVASAPQASLGHQIAQLVWIGPATAFFTTLATMAATDVYPLLKRTLSRPKAAESPDDMSEVRLLDPATMNTWILPPGLPVQAFTAALDAAEREKRGQFMTFDPDTGAWG